MTMTTARRLIFRLALALGYANPDAMLAEIPWTVFQEWLEYMHLEPFGEYRNDVRVALPITQLANVLGRRKGRPAFKVKQFLPDWTPREPPKKRTPDQLLEKMIAMNRAFGGKFIDKRKPANV